MSALKDELGKRDLSTLNPKHMAEHLDSIARQPGGKQLARKAAIEYMRLVYAKFLAEDKTNGTPFDSAVLDALGALEGKAFSA